MWEWCRNHEEEEEEEEEEELGGAKQLCGVSAQCPVPFRARMGDGAVFRLSQRDIETRSRWMTHPYAPWVALAGNAGPALSTESGGSPDDGGGGGHAAGSGDVAPPAASGRREPRAPAKAPPPGFNPDAAWFWRPTSEGASLKRYVAEGADEGRHWIAKEDGNLLFWLDDLGPWFTQRLNNDGHRRWGNRTTGHWFWEDFSEW